MSKRKFYTVEDRATGRWDVFERLPQPPPDDLAAAKREAWVLSAVTMQKAARMAVQ